MPPSLGDLRLAREAAEAEWIEQSAALADGLLAMADPGARASAYAALSAHLARTGDGLLPGDEARVRASFGPGRVAASSSDSERAAAERARAARRERWLAERAAAERLDRMRRFAPFLAVAAAAIPTAAAWGWGWGPGALPGVALDLFALPAAPVLGCLSAVAAAGLAAWLMPWAETHRGLRIGIGAAFAAGVAAVVCARVLPVYVARERAMVAGGHSLAGAVVRVEHEDRAGSWPRGVRAHGHVLWGDGVFGRGAMLDCIGDPAQHLRGGQLGAERDGLRGVLHREDPGVGGRAWTRPEQPGAILWHAMGGCGR